MNLHEYLKLPIDLDVHRGTVMLAQLLEVIGSIFFNHQLSYLLVVQGVTFLHKNCVSQRDMKSDNILLELDHYGTKKTH